MAAARRKLPPEWVVAAVYVAGLFMTILDTMVVNVALPTLTREFDVTTGSIEWVVTGYLLSLAVFIPASGWIGDRFGTKRVFLFALAVFTAASGACGASTSLTMLVAFRILQGVGGGMLTPTGLAMLWRAFPPERRATASKILIVPTALAPALGPIIGGTLVDHASWRWCFYVNLPLGCATFFFGLVFLTEHREPRTGRFDLGGFVLSGAALALLLYALAQGPVKGWGSTVVLAAGATAAACFLLMVAVELRTAHPMLHLRLLTNRIFRTTNLSSFLLTAAFLGSLFVLPLYLQTVRGATAMESGLTTFPEALGVITASQLVGRLYPVIGPRRLISGGLGVMALGFLAMSRLIDLDTSLWNIRFIMFGLGVCLAFCLIPLQASAFATIAPSETGDASAIFNAVRQTGSAVGVAALATVLSIALPDAGAVGDGATPYKAAFLVAASLAAVGALVALSIRDSDAASTMRPRLRRRAANEAAPPVGSEALVT
jgi:EmrB/QacA subfamily drug resistance transporter